VRLVAFDYVPSDGAVARALGAEPNALLQRSVRVRSVDGVPFSYLTTHVPEGVSITFTKQELASRPLLELLERAGVKAERARQRISAVSASAEVAQALAVPRGSPLVELVRIVFDQDGRGVEHLHALYRPDRYALEFDLVRSGSEEAKGWSPVMAAPRRTSVRRTDRKRLTKTSSSRIAKKRGVT
jgi:GntR family transcriptional regulator